MPSLRRSERFYRYPYEDNDGMASEKYAGQITFTALRRTTSTTTSRPGPDALGFPQSPTSTPKVKRHPQGTVELALPPGLSFSDGMDYEGAVLNRQNEAARRAANALTGAEGFGGRTSALINEIKGAASESLSQGRGDAVDVAVGQALRFAGALTGTQYGAIVGSNQVARSHTFSMFRNVNLRTFQYNFNLFPTSPAEAEQIEGIVKFFRKHMYPETVGDNLFGAFKFPTIFEIQMLYQGRKIKPLLKPCYLTGMNTTYNGETTSFHHDGKFTQTTISMSFQEEHNLVRKDIEEGF